ncbi:adapter SH3BGRL isoform X1 [Dasypus novemcinctus]|uniref:adapter SH3BGRL isoform X1 n=1 Tax=Dasypus novemcinctus TaxID=9361 RepID=UPI0039C90971
MGGGGALASSLSTFPHPPLPTSVQLLARFQLLLLQLLHNRVQDPNNRRNCSQDGDPCVYCVFFWFYCGPGWQQQQVAEAQEAVSNEGSGAEEGGEYDGDTNVQFGGRYLAVASKGGQCPILVDLGGYKVYLLLKVPNDSALQVVDLFLAAKSGRGRLCDGLEDRSCEDKSRQGTSDGGGGSVGSGGDVGEDNKKAKVSTGVREADVNGAGRHGAAQSATQWGFKQKKEGGGG